MRLRAIVLDRIKSNYSRSLPLFPVVGQLINRPSSLRPMSTAPPADLPTQIAELGAQIKKLKLAKQPCEPEIQRLKDLKALLPKSDAPVSVPLAVGQKGKSKVGVEAHGKLSLKVPKGTRDFHAQDTTVRRKIFSTLETIFQKHGASTIDTPVFELKEILAGKYGEDSKLIYDLQDQGGELCSLRYDLTVPFARYLAMNGVVAMKRYHIAKVYRRDQPAMSKGRLREFYQCDFDIAGVYDAMVPDAEILSILCEALTALDIGDFTVKINHRKILDGIFSLCGVPESSIRAISSAVDKLDKAPWEVVKKEMVEEKGLDPVIADKIGEYVKLKGRGWELLDILEKDANLNSNASAAAGLKDMRILFEYLDVYGCLEKMSFDLSLARGLDYYTGIIYEAITELSAPPSQSVVPSIEPALPAAATTPVSGQTAPSSTANKKEGDEIDESTVGVGSIAAGGRYDNLVGMFTTAASGAQGKAADREMTRNRVPCVGISVGVERVYAIMMAKQAERERLTGKAARGKETEVYVMSVGDGLIKERMQICKELWEAGIKAEFMYKVKPKGARAQFDVIDRDSIPFAVIIGSDELQGGTVKIKEQAKSKEDVEANGVDVKRTEMIDWLKEKIRTLEA